MIAACRQRRWRSTDVKRIQRIAILFANSRKGSTKEEELSRLEKTASLYLILQYVQIGKAKKATEKNEYTASVQSRPI